MNYAVFRELSDDLSRRGWIALTDQPGRALSSLVSTVPSVTAMSRASLLTGTLRAGNSAAEKQWLCRSCRTAGGLTPRRAPVPVSQRETW